MNPTWKALLIGLANAAVSGAASGVLVCYVDPKDFNFHNGFANLATLTGGAALISIAKWLLQHPLPGAPANGNGQAH